MWRKSTFSETEACVEVAWQANQVVGIRDSKRPGDRHLTVPATAFRALHRTFGR